MAVYVPWKAINQWRETGRTVKLGPFDGKLGLVFILMFLFPSYELFILCLVALGIFYVLQYYGYTLPNALRKIFVMIGGRKKGAVHYWREGKFRY